MFPRFLHDLVWRCDSFWPRVWEQKQSVQWWSQLRGHRDCLLSPPMAWNADPVDTVGTMPSSITQLKATPQVTAQPRIKRSLVPNTMELAYQSRVWTFMCEREVLPSRLNHCLVFVILGSLRYSSPHFLDECILASSSCSPWCFS